MKNWLESLKDYVDTLETNLGLVKTQTDKIPKLLSFKDQWCAAPTASWALTNVGQDLSASDVVFPTGFLPTGATIQAIYLMFKWRKQVDSSAGENKISAASKTIRVMKSGAAWGTDDIVAITFALNQLLTATSAAEGGDMIIGDVDVKGKVDDVDNQAYNVATHNSDGRNDGLVVTAASLTIYDVYTGFRVYYTV